MLRVLPAVRNAWGRLLREMQGASALETALALAVGLPLCLYGFEICMMTYTDGVLGDAARLGVRYAIVHGTDSTNCSGPSTGCGDPSGLNVAQVVSSDAQISFHDMSKLSVTVSYPDGTSTPNSHVRISVAYTYVPYINYAALAQNLTATAEGVIVY